MRDSEEVSSGARNLIVVVDGLFWGEGAEQSGSCAGGTDVGDGCMELHQASGQWRQATQQPASQPSAGVTYLAGRGGARVYPD